MNLTDLDLSLDASFGSFGSSHSIKQSQMGSIQLDSDMTGEISSLLRSTEDSERCLTGVSLLRSSWEAVSSFSKASACKFSALGMCLI